MGDIMNDLSKGRFTGKKLLFLFPIEEYFQYFTYRPNYVRTIELLNDTINKRYRKKGYKLYFALFPDTPLIHINQREEDTIRRYYYIF